MSAGNIITIAVILAAAAAMGVGVLVVRSKIRGLSRTLFGTDSLTEGIKGTKQNAEQMRETPRSLHGMTTVYSPMIKRDFPELDLEQYFNKTESFLRGWFNAVEQKRISALTEEYTPDLRDSVQGMIDRISSDGNTRHFEDLNIHDVEIARYIKNGATVTILFEAAVSYYSYVTNADGDVVFGSKTDKCQTVYEVGLMYVQDVDLVHNRASALGVTCPSCGAPIKSLGEKFCAFCGTAVKEINIRSWKFNSVNEQTLQQRKY